MTVEIAGYEGDWLDPDDVQGYLEERGILIDPSASFVEAEVMVNGAGDIIVGPEGMPAAAVPEFQDPMNLAPEGQWDDIFTPGDLTNVGFSDAQTGSWMNFLQPGEAIKRPDREERWNDDSTAWTGDLSLASGQAQQVRKKRIVIDVRKLVKGTHFSLVCVAWAADGGVG